MNEIIIAVIILIFPVLRFFVVGVAVKSPNLWHSKPAFMQ